MPAGAFRPALIPAGHAALSAVSMEKSWPAYGRPLHGGLHIRL